MHLYLNFSRPLSEGEVEVLRELVKRRGRREPLQHIVGSTSFCGLEIAVSRHVLVPRPETELLAEKGWVFLNEVSGIGSGASSARPSPPGEAGEKRPRAPDHLSTLAPRPSTALDWGTGSGCVGIALAAKCPAARIDAVDRSGEALELARQNAARHGLAERLRFLQGDGFGAVPADAKYNLIISNPPYIPTAEIAGLEPEVRDYDPREALDGGADGLDYFRRLGAEGAAWLKPGGRIMVEFGDGQGERLAELFERQKWIVETVVEDYTHRPRILVARSWTVC